MSEEFRILREETFNYKNKKRLFLMLIREGGRYATEIVTAEETYGRKFFDDRDEAEKVFDYFTEKLAERTDYDSIIKILTASKKLGMKEISFLFNVYGKKLGQVYIGEMIENFKFKIKSKVSEDDAMVIKIYFKTRLKCIGEFKGTFLKDDFVFYINS